MVLLLLYQSSNYQVPGIDITLIQSQVLYNCPLWGVLGVRGHVVPFNLLDSRPNMNISQKNRNLQKITDQPRLHPYSLLYLVRTGTGLIVKYKILKIQKLLGVNATYLQW